MMSLTTLSSNTCGGSMRVRRASKLAADVLARLALIESYLATMRDDVARHGGEIEAIEVRPAGVERLYGQRAVERASPHGRTSVQPPPMTRRRAPLSRHRPWWPPRIRVLGSIAWRHVGYRTPRGYRAQPFFSRRPFQKELVSRLGDLAARAHRPSPRRVGCGWPRTSRQIRE